MRYSLIIFLLVLISVSGTAQKLSALNKFKITRRLTTEYFVFEKNNRSGIVNKSGRVILPAIYTKVFYTRFRLFVVKNDTALGVVKEKNQSVLPFIFDRIDILSSNRIHVSKYDISSIVNDKNMFLKDTSILPVLVFQNSKINDTIPSYVLTKSTHIFARRTERGYEQYVLIGRDTVVIDSSHIKLLTQDETLYAYEKNRLWGILSADRKEIAKPIYEGIFEIPTTGLLQVGSNGKWGIIRRDLSIVLPQEYGFMYFNKDGIAIAYNKTNNTVGLIRGDGTFLLKPIKASISDYKGGFFIIHYNGKGDVVDRNLKSILPKDLEYVALYSNLLLVKQNNKMGVFHALGYLLISPMYERLEFNGISQQETNIFKASHEGKWGIVNDKGKLIVPYQYDDLFDFIDGYCQATLHKKEGIINELGNVTVPLIYDDVAFKFNSENLLRVTQKEKYGFVNKKGEVVIPVIYEYVDDDFKDGLCEAWMNGKCGFLNASGEVVIPFEYDKAYNLYRDGEGYIEVLKNGMRFNIDKKGKRIEEMEN